VSSGARAIALDVANQLLGQGAEAVVLGGSIARRDDHALSDIDLCAIGDGPAYHLRIVEGRRLVSISWRTPDGVRALLDSPPDAGGAVPAWRGAELLVDPGGVAGMLQRFAHEWRWARIDDRCDEWVAEQLPGYAEEVFRLVGLLGAGRVVPASAVRAVLALRIPHIVAVHRRLFYDSENALWDLVAATMGDPWRAASITALGAATAGDVDAREACRAALRLWVLAARDVDPVLSVQAREVVAAAIAIAVEFAGAVA